MQIFNQSGSLVLSVEVDDNSYRNRIIMGDHSLTLYYSLDEHVEIPVGAYCFFEGARYTLMRPEQLKMKHSRFYEYSVTFSSEQEKLKMWKFRNPVDSRLKFPLTAKPKEHLQMIVDNLNLRDSGWTVGSCIDDVEKLISYDHDYCWDALNKQASEFQTEFEIVGKCVSLNKVEYNKSNPLPLAYGKGNGFKSGVGRSNAGSYPIETLYVQGGDRNIDRSKYPSDEILRASSNGCLLLPSSQTIGFDGEHFEDEQGYNEKNARHYQVDSLGLSIRNSDREPASGAEDSLDRSDDYPKRVGKVKQLIVADESKNFYDIVDDTIPEELNYEDYLIAGEQMTLIFQSGNLAGKEFEVKYKHKKKKFEIVPQEIDGVTMPGGAFLPKDGEDGDTYAIFNVMLPDAYIRNDSDKSGASWDMFRAAVKFLYDNEDIKFTFKGELDGVWAKNNWSEIGNRLIPGNFIKFTNDDFAKDGAVVRITSIKDYINNPHSPKIELSNETVSGSVSSVLKELESTEVVIDENRKAAMQYAKRRFRDAKETIEMLEKALLDNFSPSINPVTVKTMSMLVGDESLQFVFTQSIESDETAPHIVFYNKANKKVTIAESYLKHLTLGINSIKNEHESSEYRRWFIAPFESEPLFNGDRSYYLYAVVPENGRTGIYQLLENAKELKPGDGNYYLLVGILNSEYDGSRSFAPMYGFTEILPGRITTDMIASANGKAYFNLKDGIIGGRIQFSSESKGLSELPEYKDLQKSDQQNSVDLARLANTIIDGGYIRTNLINTAELIAQRVLAGDPSGQRIELDPTSKTIQVVSDDGTTTIYEGNQYEDPISLFGNTSGTIRMTDIDGYYDFKGEFNVFESKQISELFHTDAPVEITINGNLYCSASSDKNTDGEEDKEATDNFSNMYLALFLNTYTDSDTPQLISRKLIAQVNVNSTGEKDIDGTYPNLNNESKTSFNNFRIVAPSAGNHCIEAQIIANSSEGGRATARWGDEQPLTASFVSDYYVSRYFNNGYLLGTSKQNYILAYKDPVKGMSFIAENGGHGFKFNSDGVKIKRNNGGWTDL